MKKTNFIFMSVALAAMFTSCSFIGVIDDLQDAAKEVEEINSGKVFEIKSATLKYSNGMIFAFDDYGKKQRIEDTTAVVIYTGSDIYALDTEEKTYIVTTYDGEYSYFSGFCFPEATWVAAAKLAYGTLDKKNETIAGKKCTIYSYTEDGHTDSFGGWKRIVFLSEDGSSDGFRATEFSETVAGDAFTVPKDYKKIEY